MGQVAPHQYKELELILAGTKPLAAIEKSKDPTGYAWALYQASVHVIACYYLENEVIITLPKNMHLIGQYLQLLNHGVDQFGIKEYHRKMGKLFGYTSDDIEAFIKAEIHCNCKKCTGA